MDWLVSTLGSRGAGGGSSAVGSSGTGSYGQEQAGGSSGSSSFRTNVNAAFEKYPQIVSELEEAVVAEAARQPHHDLDAAQAVLKKWTSYLLRPAEDLSNSAVSHQILGLAAAVAAESSSNSDEAHNSFPSFSSPGGLMLNNDGWKNSNYDRDHVSSEGSTSRVAVDAGPHAITSGSASGSRASTTTSSKALAGGRPHLGELITNQTPFPVYDKLNAKRVLSFRQVLLRTQAIEFLFSHIAGLDAEPPRTVADVAASGAASTIRAANKAVVFAARSDADSGGRTKSSAAIVGGREGSPSKVLGAPLAPGEGGGSVYSGAGAVPSSFAPPGRVGGGAKHDRHVDPAAGPPASKSSFFVPTPPKQEKSPTGPLAARSNPFGDEEDGDNHNSIGGATRSGSQSFQSSNPFGEDDTNALGGGNFKHRTSPTASHAAATNKAAVHASYSDVFGDGASSSLSCSGAINSSSTPEKSRLGSGSGPGCKNQRPDKVGTAITTIYASNSTPHPTGPSAARMSNYPPEFLQTLMEFFELTLRTSKLNGLLLEALQTSKQAVQVLSWLKDADQDLVGVEMGGDRASSNNAPSSSGTTDGSLCVELLRKRDAPLVERDLKALEMRLSEICSGGGSALVGRRMVSGAGGGGSSEHGALSSATSIQGGGSSAGSAALGAGSSKANLATGARSPSGGAASALAKANGGGSVGVAGSKKPYDKISAQELLSGTGSVQVELLPGFLQQQERSGRLKSLVDTYGASTSPLKARAGAASDVRPRGRNGTLGSAGGGGAASNNISTDQMGQDAVRRLNLSTLLNNNQAQSNSNTSIHAEYGVEDTTFALLVRQLILPIFAQAVGDQMELVSAERAQVLSRKVLLQRRLHEEAWAGKLAGFVRQIEQLLLMLVMVLKLQTRGEGVKKRKGVAEEEGASLVQNLAKNMAETDLAVKKLTENQADLEERRRQVSASIDSQGLSVRQKLAEIQQVRAKLVDEKQALLKRLEEITHKIEFFDNEERSLEQQFGKNEEQQQYISDSFDTQIAEDHAKLLTKTDQKMTQCSLLALAHQAKDHVAASYSTEVATLASRTRVKEKQLARQLLQFLSSVKGETLEAARQIGVARSGGGDDHAGRGDSGEGSLAATDAELFIVAQVENTVAQITSILKSAGVVITPATKNYISSERSGNNDPPKNPICSGARRPSLSSANAGGLPQPRGDLNDVAAPRGGAGPSSAIDEQQAAEKTSGTTTKAGAILAWDADSESEVSSEVVPEEVVEGGDGRAIPSGKNVEQGETASKLLRFEYRDGGTLREIFAILQQQGQGGAAAAAAASTSTACADCGREDSSVSWASLTHGVFLCLKCAGLHRGLGVHTSFVRSTTMDKWGWREVARMFCAAYLARPGEAGPWGADAEGMAKYSGFQDEADREQKNSNPDAALIQERYTSEKAQIRRKLLDWAEEEFVKKALARVAAAAESSNESSSGKLSTEAVAVAVPCTRASFWETNPETLLPRGPSFKKEVERIERSAREVFGEQDEERAGGEGSWAQVEEALREIISQVGRSE